MMRIQPHISTVPAWLALMHGGRAGAGRAGGMTWRRAAGRRRRPVKIGVPIPLSGAAGIWGPSCHSSALLAVAELNQAGGLDGREIELVVRDAGREPQAVADAVEALVDDDGAEAIVGMHISAVRQAIVGRIGGRVPYVYTPLYEGGERTPGVYAIGETPDQQLRPAIHWLAETSGATRWALIGNDYVWPRVSHRLARRYIAETGGRLTGETYVPFGCADFSALLAGLRRQRPDAVLMSLVGEDAVMFSRQFAEAGLASRMLRLSAAVEENSLLAIGEAGTENLYATTGYLGRRGSADNNAFLERYHTAFGAQAPVVNALGESCYEGFHFLAAAARQAGSLDVRAVDQVADGVVYRGARGPLRLRRGKVDMPIYLAEAQGLEFAARAEFAPPGLPSSS